MKLNQHCLIFLGFLLGSALVGCGSIDPSAKDTDSDTGSPDGGADSDTGDNFENDYYPMAVGDFWTYRETEAGVSVEFTYEVTGKETMDFGRDTGEREVFVVENYSVDGTSSSSEEGRTQYIENDTDRAVRHRQDIYDTQGVFTKQRDFFPGFLRFDRTKVKTGDTWTETLLRVSDPKDGSTPVEETVRYDYEVIGTDETVDIESTTYHCLELKRTAQKDGEVKYYWYVKGIGKVQELTGGTKLEQLIDSSYF